MNAIAGCDKDCTDTLVNCGTVHVNRGAERKNKRGHFFFCTELFRAAHIDRKCSYGRSTGKCKHDRRKHALEEFDRAHTTHRLYSDGINDNGMYDVADVRGEKYHRQRTDNGRSV